MRTPLLLMFLAVLPEARAETHTLPTFAKQRLTENYHSEGAAAADVDNDGHPDLIYGPLWFSGPDFATAHEIFDATPFPSDRGYANSFFIFPYDFDRDGWIDVLHWGLPGTPASVYLNPKNKADRWAAHEVFPFVGNESPTFADMDGNGTPDLVCVCDGRVGYATFDPENPLAPWAFVACGFGGLGKFTHGLGVGDVDGDGKPDILTANGWLQNPGGAGGPWKSHVAAFGGGGAQMFVYDVDGDGDGDVITSLAAHQWGLSWFEQKADGGFAEHRLMGSKPEENPYGVCFSQLHAMELADLDGDGLKDIVTGKCYWAHNGHDPGARDPAVLYWFRLVRESGKAEFVPHRIDADSGLGRQIGIADLNGDGFPDIVTGNKKGAFAFVQSRRNADEVEWKNAQPRRLGEPDVLEFEGLSGEDAAKAMSVPDGFHVTLAAAEPDVCQPIAMAYDDRGRLWVAEAYCYPQRRKDEEANDRILIFEDRDGDGKFDDRKVFAENLNLVSGLEVGFGGVWVGAAPYLLFIPDRDGDDKPDGEPQILLDGWGHQDTHETLNSFIWGPDGWLYGCHGVFTHSNVGKPGAPGEERQQINAGVWRYHPVRHAFEVFAYGTSNPWGVDFDDHGQAFLTACVIPHLFHVIQGGRYHRQAGQHFNPYVYDDIKTIAEHRHWIGNTPHAGNNKSDAAGGGHAHSGAMIYLGDRWPSEYRDQIFMNNIHGARLNRDRLTRKGSGYVGSRAPDFLLAHDRASQILNIRYGPDGNAHMIDWYDTQQCHSGDIARHDRSNGRIFRVSYGDNQPVSVDMRRKTNAELVDYQLHKNDWFVRHARRILQERAAAGALSADTAPGLRAILKDSADTTRRLRALWALHVIGTDTDAYLTDTDPFVRAWAIQFVSDATRLPEDDTHPAVRLYLASALQRLPVAQRWPIAENLVAHAEDASDHNLPLMIWYGVEPLVAADPARAIALVGKAKIPLIQQYLLRRATALDDPSPVLAALGAADGEAEQLMILDQVAAAVKGRARLPTPEGWAEILPKLSASPNERIRDLALSLTVRFGDRSVFPLLRAIAENPAAPAERRRLALDTLLNGQADGLAPALLKLLDDPTMRLHAIRGLSRYADDAVPRALLSRYASLSPEEKREAVSTLASRPVWAKTLLADDAVPSSDVSAFAIRQMSRFEDPDIDSKIASRWGGVRKLGEDKARQIAALKQALDAASADRAAGRVVFNATCASCHVLFGHGNAIGPDLTGSNRADIDYLLENILDPSAIIGRDYQMNVVHLKDGRIVSGMAKEENDSALTLQLLTEISVIEKDDIIRRDIPPVSMMPEGLLLPLTAAQTNDLIAYLGSPSQVPLPGTEPIRLEGENMRMLEKTAGRPEKQPMGGFPDGKWSGDAQLWWTGAGPGDKLVLELEVPKTGRYQVAAAFTKARDYGIFRITLGDEPPGAPIDFFHAPQVIHTGELNLGSASLGKGSNRLTFEITGTNPAAIKAYMLGIDYFELTPID